MDEYTSGERHAVSVDNPGIKSDHILHISCSYITLCDIWYCSYTDTNIVENFNRATVNSSVENSK